MKAPQPPKRAQQFLRWFCRRDLAEAILGDLAELYQRNYTKFGKIKADLLFYWHIMSLFQPIMFKKCNPFMLSNHIAMFRHYTKIGFRQLKKNKLYTAINLSGLTIGLTCFILIAMYIQYEFSFDTQHAKADRIYRVSQTQEGNEFRGTDRFALAPMPLGPAVKEEFPEITEAVTLQVQEELIVYEEKAYIKKGMFAEASVFDIFNLEMIEGEGEKALKSPDGIILTQSTAKLLFGDQSPINQQVKIIKDQLLTVKGIIKDPPRNQHFTYDYITALENYPYYGYDEGKWGSNNYRAYVVIPPPYDYKEVEKKLISFTTPFVEEAYSNAPFSAEYYLQPLLDIHLFSHANFELKGNSDIRYIYLLISIGFIILFLATVNYINLSTAQAVQRTKEVGMRKVLGALKWQIIFQLLGESVLLTLLSFSIAFMAAYFLLPILSEAFYQPIPFTFQYFPSALIGMLVVAFSICGGSGLYPALYLSSFHPAKSLKGKLLIIDKWSALFRNSLVIGQFTAAIVLAIGSIIIYQQLQFIQSKKLGYNKDQVVYIPFGNDSGVNENAQILRNELLKDPQISKVALSNSVPLNVNNQGIASKWEGNDNQENIWIYRFNVDPHFLDLFEMEIVEGRNFDPAYPTDSTNSCLLNEAAVRKLGWREPLGKSFEGRTVIGIVKDFHFQPFDLAIEPMRIYWRTKQYAYNGVLVLKLNPKGLDRTLAHIQTTLKGIVPLLPYDVRFMDQSYDQLYKSEQQIGQAFNVFTFIALFIACMGLFGLVAHKVVQRTKEIGIRKVLGASVSNIVVLIARDFLGLVIVANLIAFPLAYWGMNQWLQDFAYRIDIQWTIFLLAGIIAIGISFLTISGHSVKAALANPIDALRDE